jgi:hypothetical protein
MVARWILAGGLMRLALAAGLFLFTPRLRITIAHGILEGMDSSVIKAVSFVPFTCTGLIHLSAA